MSAGAISGASFGVNAKEGASSGGFGALSSGEFIKVLLTELSNQDPFEPQDSAALLEQLSSLRNIESQLNLQDKLEDLVLQNQVTAAGGLIGKQVSGLDVSNLPVQGTVQSVRVQDGNAILELENRQSIAMDRVTNILGSGAEEQNQALNSELLAAEGLIGKVVTGIQGSTVVEGMVTAVGFDLGRVALELDNGKFMLIDEVVRLAGE